MYRASGFFQIAAIIFYLHGASMQVGIWSGGLDQLAESSLLVSVYFNSSTEPLGALNAAKHLKT